MFRCKRPQFCRKFIAMRLALLTGVAMMLAQLSFAQGTIRGKVISAETGEELIGAAVIIAGTTHGASADLDGNYTITDVPVGQVDLVCQFISFEADTIRGLEVKDGEVTIQDFQMGSAAIAIEEFVVEAKQKRSSENYMLTLQKKSATVMDGISSQQIARNGDGDVASAAKRVTGIQVEGGKYVYVRGLTDRYSLTTLNGSIIPGLDPNRNTVQMDIFPTNLIDNIQIVKSFTPDLPGSFTGGLVDIRTKDFPERFTFKMSSSIGFNSQALNTNGFLTSERSSTDWLGFDNGLREMPEQVRDGQAIPPATDKEGRAELSRSFSKEMAPTTGKGGLNKSFAVSVGDQKQLKNGSSFGYITGFTVQEDFEHRGDYDIGVYKNLGQSAQELQTLRSFKSTQSTQTNQVGFLGAVSYKMNGNNKFSLNYFFNQNGANNARYGRGPKPEEEVGFIVESREIQYLQRSLGSLQARGEHYTDRWGGVKVDWSASYTNSTQYEPDRRFFLNHFIATGEDTAYGIRQSAYNLPVRTWRDLNDKTLDLHLDITKNIKTADGKEGKVKFGGQYLTKDRTFTSRRWDYRFQNGFSESNYEGNIDEFLSDENFDPNNPDGYMVVTDLATFKKNTYDGEANIMAAYGMYDGFVTPLIRVIAGVRVEGTDYSTISQDPRSQPGSLEEFDVLPSISATYNFRENMNLRMSGTRTLARPSLREISPFATFSNDAPVEIGNPGLNRTLITNLDLRYEYFMNPGEIASVSVFYKHFDQPIERVFNPVAANPEIKWVNADEAQLAGFELEYRKSLKSY